MQALCLTDEEMVARIQQGEDTMLERLIEKYYDEVYRFCCYKTGDRVQAYDCAQETFLKLTRYIGTYRERQKFKGYLFSIARNVCNDYFRTKPSDSMGMEELADMAGNVDEFDQRETAHVVRHALEELCEEQKEAVILRFYYDFKVNEIAAIVGVPLPTAKSRLKRGIEKLKKLLEREGIGYAG